MYEVFVLSWKKYIGFIERLQKYIDFSDLRDEMLPEEKGKPTLLFGWAELELCKFI